MALRAILGDAVAEGRSVCHHDLGREFSVRSDEEAIAEVSNFGLWPRVWSPIPWRPSSALVVMMGQASFHLVPESGPSTMARSYLRGGRGGWAVVTGVTLPPTLRTENGERSLQSLAVPGAGTFRPSGRHCAEAPNY